jgi:hypothetical protein
MRSQTNSFPKKHLPLIDDLKNITIHPFWLMRSISLIYWIPSHIEASVKKLLIRGNVRVDSLAILAMG